MNYNVIDLKNVDITYNNEFVFKNFSCSFDQGKFYTLLGPSGCGKTTLLMLIAGFIKQDKGDIFIHNELANGLNPNERRVNTVFQDYALFPHLNVFENVAFGLRLKKLGNDEITERVMKALSLVNLNSYYSRDINRLSGGQKQRVAIARAIVNEPEVLLLDEPLSALDLKLRTEMQYMLKNIQKQLGITFIFITHDQEEALGMSDYIYVLNDGKIMQQGTPTDIYDEPVNRFVADFIGESNIVRAKYCDELKVEFNNNVFDCVDSGFEMNEVVDVVIRPEDVKITNVEDGMIHVKIESILFKGMHYEIVGNDLDNNEWLIHTTEKFEIGKEIGIYFNPQDLHVMRVVNE